MYTPVLESRIMGCHGNYAISHNQSGPSFDDNILHALSEFASIRKYVLVSQCKSDYLRKEVYQMIFPFLSFHQYSCICKLDDII